MAKKSSAAKKNVAEELDEAESTALALQGEVDENAEEVTDFTDPKTGEIVSAEDIKRKLLAASKALQQLEDADEEDFVLEESDLWKPSEVGDELKGIYLGMKPDGEINRHFFATRHPKTGEPFMKKTNAGHILNRELEKGGIGQGVVIRYEGMSAPKTEGKGKGKRTKLLTVKFFAPKKK